MTQNIENNRLRHLISQSYSILSKTQDKHPDYIWEVGFSGGKDSTVTLHLVLEFIKKRLEKNLKVPDKVLVIYGDTLLDIPIIRQNALNTLKAVQKFSKKYLDGLLEVVVVKPEYGKDFFSMMIEKGYPPPHYRFRWCVRTLKVQPMLNFVDAINTKFVMISGIRSDESLTRRRNIKKRQNYSSKYIMVSPIINWTKNDVFAFLSTTTQPWNGEPYNDLLKSYILLNSQNEPICTICSLSPNIRYGCWVCTVVTRDRALENLSKDNGKWKEIYKTKELIRRISRTRRFREYKDGVPRKLNESGRLAVIATIVRAMKYYPESMAGYLEDPELRGNMRSWIQKLIESNNKRVLNFAGINMDDVNEVYSVIKRKS